MELIYINNIFNHHSKDVADVFYSLLGNQFIFVETSEPKSNRSLKGANVKTFSKLPYLYSIYQNEYNKISEQKLLALTKDAKVVVQGAASDKYVKERLKLNKLTFRVSEHYRKGKRTDKLRIIKYFFRNRWLHSKPIFLLSASSHAGDDMLKARSFREKAFKWGYFPEIYAQKNRFTGQVKEILWVGRLIEFKHPEVIITAAKILQQENIAAKISVIGRGNLYKPLKEAVCANGLQKYIEFKGKKSSQEVQEAMAQADLFLFSSDIGEGWGAVLNESMGNGCIPVANVEAGSTKFLVENSINGFTYDNNMESFKVSFRKALMLTPGQIKRMKEQAYHTIHDLWCADVAARRLLMFADEYEKGHIISKYAQGPMSADFGQTSYRPEVKNEQQ